MADHTNPNQKAYHKKATGAALTTVKKHSKEHELKLYGSCFWYVTLFATKVSVVISDNAPAHSCSVSGSQCNSKALIINILRSIPTRSPSR